MVILQIIYRRIRVIHHWYDGSHHNLVTVRYIAPLLFGGWFPLVSVRLSASFQILSFDPLANTEVYTLTSWLAF